MPARGQGRSGQHVSRGGGGGGGGRELREAISLPGFLVQLRAEGHLAYLQNEAHLDMPALLRLPDAEIMALKIPRGPLVRIRAGVKLLKEGGPQQSSTKRAVGSGSLAPSNGGAAADAGGKDAKSQGGLVSAAPKNVWAAFAQTDAAKREAQAQAQAQVQAGRKDGKPDTTAAARREPTASGPELAVPVPVALGKIDDDVSTILEGRSASPPREVGLNPVSEPSHSPAPLSGAFVRRRGTQERTIAPNLQPRPLGPLALSQGRASVYEQQQPPRFRPGQKRGDSEPEPLKCHRWRRCPARIVDASATRPHTDRRPSGHGALSIRARARQHDRCDWWRRCRRVRLGSGR